MATSEHEQPAQIDWDAVWQGLEWDSEERRKAYSQQQLRQRALQYATPTVEADALTERRYTMLTFQLGAEHYGIDVMAVRGVRTLASVTRVPGTPRFYAGVVNMRGQIVSVLDLRLFFDMAVGSDAPREVVITHANGLDIGLLAHHVGGVVSLPHASVKAVDNVRYGLGVTADRLILIDIAQLLQDHRLIVSGRDESI